MKDLILSIDEANAKCADCASEKITKISINNGVVICEECAQKHAELGNEISYIKDLKDNLDDYLFNYIVMGSNSKFAKFAKDNQIDAMETAQKYRTKAADFYRRNLKNKVMGEPLADAKLENPSEIIEKSENIFPEFQNYQIKEKLKIGAEEKKHFYDGLFSLGKKVASAAKAGIAKGAEGIKKGAMFAKEKGGQAANFIKKSGNDLIKKVTKKKEDAKEEDKKEEEVNEGEQKQEEAKEEEAKAEEVKEEQKAEDNKAEDEKKEDKAENNDNKPEVKEEEKKEEKEEKTE